MNTNNATDSAQVRGLQSSDLFSNCVGKMKSPAKKARDEYNKRVVEFCKKHSVQFDHTPSRSNEWTNWVAWVGKKAGVQACLDNLEEHGDQSFGYGKTKIEALTELCPKHGLQMPNALPHPPTH